MQKCRALCGRGTFYASCMVDFSALATLYEAWGLWKCSELRHGRLTPQSTHSKPFLWLVSICHTHFQCGDWKSFRLPKSFWTCKPGLQTLEPSVTEASLNNPDRLVNFDEACLAWYGMGGKCGPGFGIQTFNVKMRWIWIRERPQGLESWGLRDVDLPQGLLQAALPPHPVQDP